MTKDSSVTSAADNLAAKIQQLRKQGFKKQPGAQDSSVDEKSRNEETPTKVNSQ